MSEENLKIIIAVLVFAASFIEVPKIKLNLWGIIGSAVGKAINAPVMARLEAMDKRVGDVENSVKDIRTDVAKVKQNSEEHRAKECRTNILAFGDELLHSEKHSQERFNQILEDIDEYNSYCASHPTFKNSRTVKTSEHILSTYERLCETNGFAY